MIGRVITWSSALGMAIVSGGHAALCQDADNAHWTVVSAPTQYVGAEAENSSGAAATHVANCVRRDTSTRFVPSRSLTIDSTTWDPEILRAVRAGEVCTGMTSEMLRVAWGLPATIRASYAPGDSTERFLYRRYIVVVHNSRVIAIRERSEDGR